jgi:hypothetical protein
MKYIIYDIGTFNRGSSWLVDDPNWFWYQVVKISLALAFQPVWPVTKEERIVDYDE